MSVSAAIGLALIVAAIATVLWWYRPRE